MNRVFILPGEMHFTKEPALVSTLLGSCVAVCLYDAKKQSGGMNHFLLPSSIGQDIPAGKCGDQAVAQLVKMARLSGSLCGDLSATVVGGGAINGHLMTPGGPQLDIGLRNGEMAERTLASLGVKVARRELGGVSGRRVSLDTASGRVETQLLPAAGSSGGVQAKKVLIVDDSATVRNVLRQGLSGDSRLVVVGEAEDPFKARELILMHDPDVITLDIIMPNLDGLSFLRRLMTYKPIPTVIISTIAKQGSEMRRMVEQAGAVGVFDKEDLALYQGIDVVRGKLIPTILKAAATPVSKRS